MTDRHGIGRAMEREAMHYAWKWYNWHGFWQPPRSKFQSQDIWGVADFVCFDTNGVLQVVQVCQDRACWVDARYAAIQEWIIHEKPLAMGCVMAYKRNKDGAVTWRRL